MVTFKKKEEIIKLREGGKILAEILQNVAHLAKPGISTARLNEIAEELIKKFGARPSFKNFRSEKNVPPYPATLCTSINDEIVHCVPSQERILKDGDILGLDLGIWYKNFCTDYWICDFAICSAGRFFGDSRFGGSWCWLWCS